MFNNRIFDIVDIPYHPVYYEYGVPYYKQEDVEHYGLPDLWGVLNYQVIECREINQPYVMEFEDEVQLAREGVNRHRYVRYMRFKYTIDRLCGYSRVVIPHDIVDMIDEELVERHPDTIWEKIRFILKFYGYKKFYDRIPCIIRKLNLPWRIHITKTHMHAILRDFQDMSDTFDELMRGGGMPDIKYFPNLRYMALKLMEKHGVQVDFYIPFIRVHKVYEKLERIRAMLH